MCSVWWYNRGTDLSFLFLENKICRALKGVILYLKIVGDSLNSTTNKQKVKMQEMKQWLI